MSIHEPPPNTLIHASLKPHQKIIRLIISRFSSISFSCLFILSVVQVVIMMIVIGVGIAIVEMLLIRGVDDLLAVMVSCILEDAWRILIHL